MALFDIVLRNGRVLDPETRMDKITNIGLIGDSIDAITSESIKGHYTIDATGLVIAPGAIDMHSHGQNDENYRIQAKDGVTTALELEVGVLDIDDWYDSREGKSLINFGASVGHIPVRKKVMRDSGEWLPKNEAAYTEASEVQIKLMKTLLHQGMRKGALAMGFGLAYTPAATRWEIIEMFRVAANYRASCHVHMRGLGLNEPLNSIEGLSELIAASAISGAPLHLVHINSSGQYAVPNLISMIEEVRGNGLDVTTECYPYAAGMTEIQSAILSEGWRERFGLDFQDLEWASTGERLTKGTFEHYRETGGMVIVHSMRQDFVDAAVTNPLTSIASDGYLNNGHGHPRTAGSYTKLLGHYVRESKKLSLMDALKKITLMPAQRLESLAPSFRTKGRIQVGSDGDLIVFNPNTIIDRATYKKPTLAPEGMSHVLVNGVPIVTNGIIQKEVSPGRGLRSPGF